jgi:hypothetical protein
MARLSPSHPSHRPHPSTRPLVLDILFVVLVSLSVALLLFVVLSPPAV